MPTNKTTDPGRHIIVCLAAKRAVSHCTASGAIGRIGARVTSHAERRAVSSEPTFSLACRYIKNCQTMDSLIQNLKWQVDADLLLS